MKKKLHITYNSPVILTFMLISFVALLLNYLTNGITNQLLFSTYRGSWINPLTYIRMFTHCLGHADFSHFSGNMLLFIILGPMLEEKYGSKILLILITITAFITGLINAILFPTVAMLGASGIVFMFILLSSFTMFKEKEIPLTFILVLFMYLGQEIINGIFVQDNISQFGHLIGGFCGSLFGFINKNYK